MANKVRFKFLKSLNKLLIILSAIAVVLTGLTVLVFALQNRFTDAEKLPLAIKTIINGLIIMLPIGLVILCFVISIIFVVNLSKKSIRVQNLSAFEAFSEVDVLCIDKNGSLTDGELEIKKVIPLKALATEIYISQNVSNVLRATDDENIITNALKKEFDFELSAGVVSVLHFNETNNYFGATFKGGKTIVIGDPKTTPIKNRVGIIKRCGEHINNGCRVLVVAEGKKPISDEGCQEELETIALIILKDHIRENAFETFKWFKNNGTIIKVISSDDAFTTSVLAAEAGIDDANKLISLNDMSEEDIKVIAGRYTVFGGATPEQKAAVIAALKENNQKVVMVGDDIGETSAMICADCSIAVNNADESAKNAADMVLNDASFSSLPYAINKSRTFIYNLYKVASLCTTKALFAAIMVLVYTLISLFSNNISIQFPFAFNNLLLWDFITNGIAAFFLLIEKNDDQIKDTFLRCVLKKVIPAFILLIVGVLIIFVLYVMQENQLINVGLYTLDTVVPMIVLLFTIFGIVFLYNICSPLNKHRTVILVSAALANVFCLAVTMVITYLTNKTEPVLQIPYLEMNGPAYITTSMIVVVLASIYVFIGQIIEIKKGENEDNEN